MTAVRDTWACRQVFDPPLWTQPHVITADDGADALRRHIGLLTREISARMGVPTVRRFRVCPLDGPDAERRARRLHFCISEVKGPGDGPARRWAWQPVFEGEDEEAA